MANGGSGTQVDLAAKAHVGSPPPRDALRAGPRTWLYLPERLDRGRRQALLDGLRDVATGIEERVQGAVDCPAKVQRAAMVGWVSDEFGLADPPVSPPGR